MAPSKWNLPDRILEGLPAAAAQIAFERNEKTGAYTYPTKERIAAMRLLAEMNRQNNPVRRVEHDHHLSLTIDERRAGLLARLSPPSDDDRGTRGDREAA